MTDREIMQQALEALEEMSGGYSQNLIVALRDRLAQPEFVKHEVENADDWSEWVCPDPQSYMMKCCDCGLVHEAQFGVVRYTDTAEKENCDMVDDPNLQAVFRMRRSEQWSPKDTAYRPGGLAQPEHEPVLLNNGRLMQYADGRIGVGTPVVQEPVIDCPRCGHCCPQRKE